MPRSRHTDWMELKQPFQMQTQVSAKQPISVPSWDTKRFEPTTKVTSAAMTALMGRTFQSLWYRNMRKNLPR